MSQKIRRLTFLHRVKLIEMVKKLCKAGLGANLIRRNALFMLAIILQIRRVMWLLGLVNDTMKWWTLDQM